MDPDTGTHCSLPPTKEPVVEQFKMCVLCTSSPQGLTLPWHVLCENLQRCGSESPASITRFRAPQFLMQSTFVSHASGAVLAS